MKHNKKNKGFTLVETIVSLLMVTMITGMLLLIVDSAKNSYVQLEKNSEGQILSSILVEQIQDELRYATNINPVLDADGKIASYNYYSDSLKQSNCEIVGKDTANGKRIYIVSSSGDYQPLVGNSSYVFDLEADIKVDYKTNANKFAIELTVYDSSNTVIKTNFDINVLNK